MQSSFKFRFWAECEVIVMLQAEDPSVILDSSITRGARRRVDARLGQVGSGCARRPQEEPIVYLTSS